MNIVKNCACAAALFALVVGVTGSQATAQGIAMRGTFTLPFEAHWADVVLQPGDYSFSLPSATNNAPVMRITGQGKTVLVAVPASTSAPESDRSYLKVENVGGTYVIRQFNSPVTRELITFPITKSVRKGMLAQNQAVTIPVPVAGGR